MQLFSCKIFLWSVDSGGKAAITVTTTLALLSSVKITVAARTPPLAAVARPPTSSASPDGKASPIPHGASEVCGGKLAECQSTGCWQDAPRFGGQKDVWSAAQLNTA